MEMILARGTKADGTYREKIAYSNLTQEEVAAILKDLRERYTAGIQHYGTELRMIQVQSWMQMIRSVKDIDLMIKEYA
jgi:hypothetical protein